MISKMKKAAEEDNLRSFSKYDLKYHVIIVSMTENPMIIRAYDILKSVLRESMISVIEKMKYEPALDFHQRILDAMRSGDPVLAEALMREHIRQNYAYFEQ